MTNWKSDEIEHTKITKKNVPLYSVLYDTLPIRKTAQDAPLDGEGCADPVPRKVRSQEEAITFDTNLLAFSLTIH